MKSVPTVYCLSDNDNLDGLRVLEADPILSLRRDFAIFDEQRVVLRKNPGFGSLVDFCTTTREVFAAAQDAYLISADTSHYGAYREILTNVISSIEESKTDIETAIANCDENHREQASGYGDSIFHRQHWATVLRDGGLEAMYREFLRFAKGDGTEESLVPSRFQAAGKRSIPLMRKLFARNALAWLIHKSAFVYAELGLEKGPFLESARTHLKLIGTVFECLKCILRASTIQNLKKIAKSEADCSSSDAAEPFLEVVSRLLQLLEKSVIRPLEELESLATTNAGVAADQLHAKKRIGACRNAVARIQFLAEWTLRQMDLRDGIENSENVTLQILVYPARRRNDGVLAHCLDFDLVARAADNDGALSKVSSLIDYQFADLIGASPVSYAKPLPAPFEYIECCGEEVETRDPITTPKWNADVCILCQHPLDITDATLQNSTE